MIASSLLHKVKAGDVLGFIGLDGKLADYHRGVAWTAHSSQGDKAWFPQSGVGHWNYEFYLNAFFSSYRHAVVSTETLLFSRA